MGFIILLLVYALAVVSSLRTKNFIIKTQNDDLTTQEVKDMISLTQTSYKDKSLRQDTSRINHCFKLSKDLAYSIALKFYPKSKHPFLELSVNEITMLTGYITSRINDILNHRGIRMLRKLKISTIVDFSIKTKDIEESKAFQTTKSITENINKAKYVIDIINPLKWGRKLIVDKIINIIIDHICLVIIAITGEETYKIYSKKVFNKDIDIDTGTIDLIDEMSDSLKLAANQLNDGEDFYIKNNKYKLKTNVFIHKPYNPNIITYDYKYNLKKKVEE